MDVAKNPLAGSFVREPIVCPKQKSVSTKITVSIRIENLLVIDVNNSSTSVCKWNGNIETNDARFCSEKNSTKTSAVISSNLVSKDTISIIRLAKFMLELTSNKTN